MESQWPEPSFVSGEFKDVFQFAQTFELHCAKVYDHAAKYPDGAASATYVMDLVSQAYRAVHSLHMQKMATSYLDQDTATASLRSKAMEYRETQELPPSGHTEVVASAKDADEDQSEENVRRDIENFFSRDLEEDSDDSDWDESSEEDSDDEYYEYNEESEEEDEDIRGIRRTQRVRTIHEVPEDDLPEMNQSPPINLTAPKNADTTDDAAFTPPIMSPEKQAAHDRITAALQRISAKFEDADPVPLARRTKIPLQQTPPQTDDSQSEATTIRAESTCDPLSPPQTATERGSSAPGTASAAPVAPTLERKASYDGTGVTAAQGSLSWRPSVAVLPRRIKTVCHRYVRRAMLPIRGKAH
ncbi:uncharacterized protein N7496_007179 [Penicillium cataractarum]|uniref:Uncharacterized protein n=1 Tax=Penicillium cataractarum TaxID=2100454 RepID=A0A9W9S3P9_9EURO|nr:uncharacterized protein N7496_007179 [Penicillium cataractarum]KAJ5371087.1 hypothetical protein N7496_007179 [Penicillium cataractarum]